MRDETGCTCCRGEGCRCCRDAVYAKIAEQMQLGVTEEALEEARNRRRAALGAPYVKAKQSLWKRMFTALFTREIERD